MISVSQVDDILLRHSCDFGTEIVSLADAAGRILQEPILADRAFPPFDRVAMDGIAIRHKAYAGGLRQFQLVGTVGAGQPPLPLPGPRDCLEVMTGCVLPPGADCVIRVEDLEVNDQTVTIRPNAKVVHRQNIHAQASDNAAGTPLLEPGQRLLAPQIAVLATVGKSRVRVGRTPRIAIVATGDELVPIEKSPEPHQIRMSNVHAIDSALTADLASHTASFHLQDDKATLRDRLAEILNSHDLVILSGGISMGKFDYVPEILASLGVQLQVRTVKQRPGKPFCFGQAVDGPTVFALPGNPVSTLTCFARYVRPYLVNAMGGTLRRQSARLAAPFDFAKDLTYFMPVCTHLDDDGQCIAERVHLTGSGDLSNLAKSDGFLELPAEPDHFAAGTLSAYYTW